MITDKVKSEIAKLAVEPIINRLTGIGREQVEESFCVPRCGRRPDGQFCDDAEAVYRRTLAILFKYYRRLN